LELARLDRAERQRLLVPAAEVRSCWLTIATTVRNKILGLARKVSPRLVNVRAAAEAEAVLYAECCEALEELASMPIAMEAPDGKQQDDGERSLSA
jgi:hypothetical protein